MMQGCVGNKIPYSWCDAWWLVEDHGSWDDKYRAILGMLDVKGLECLGWVR